MDNHTKERVGNDDAAAAKFHDRQKHTPGPWVIHSIDNDPVEYRTVILGARDWHIAEVRPSASFHGPIGNDESEANARLIAAAPDMLAALRDIRGMIRVHRDNIPWGIISEIETIDAAIAKATGAEPRHLSTDEGQEQRERAERAP